MRKKLLSTLQYNSVSPADAPLPSKDADAIWPVIDRRKTELKYVISNIVD